MATSALALSSSSSSSSSSSVAATAVAKKFRFDSFAEEFACKEEDIDIGDNDSGIGEF